MVINIMPTPSLGQQSGRAEFSWIPDNRVQILVVQLKQEKKKAIPSYSQ